MKHTLLKLSSLAVLCALWMGLSGAGEVIDRVAAVVDDEIILLSEVDEMLFTLASRGQLSVRDSTELEAARREILDRLIEDKLVVHRAKSLNLKVSEAELAPRVEDALKEIRNQFPDEDAFQKALKDEGVTLTMLRERYTDQLRNDQLKQMVLSREIRDKAEVTSDDVKSYYEESKDKLPKRADEMHLRHMLFQLSDPGQENAARAEAEALRDTLNAGTPFVDAVDGLQAVTSPQRFCKGDLDPSLEAALTDMQPGETSDPVFGPAGFTVLHMTAREDDCYELVYAVVPVEPSPELKAEAKERAEAARERVMSGEPFAEVAEETSDDPATKEKGGDMGFVTMEGVPPDIAELLQGLPLEKISDVVEAPDGYHVFQVLSRRKGGDYDFEEIRQQLRQYLENQKFEEAYNDWLAAIRDSSYVEIKAWTR